MIDLLRITAGVLAVYVIAGAVVLVPWWRARDPYARVYLVALVELVIAAGYGSLEALAQDAPGGIRVLLYTPALALVAVVQTVQIYDMWRARRARKDES